MRQAENLPVLKISRSVQGIEIKKCTNLLRGIERLPSPPNDPDLQFEGTLTTPQSEPRPITPLDSHNSEIHFHLDKIFQECPVTVLSCSQEPCTHITEREPPVTQNSLEESFAVHSQPWLISQGATLRPAVETHFASTSSRLKTSASAALAFTNLQSELTQIDTELESKNTLRQGTAAVSQQKHTRSRIEHVRFDKSNMVSVNPIEKAPVELPCAGRDCDIRAECSISEPSVGSENASNSTEKEHAPLEPKVEKSPYKELPKPPTARSLSVFEIPLMRVENVDDLISTSKPPATISNQSSLQVSESDASKQSSIHPPSVPHLPSSRTSIGASHNPPTNSPAAKADSASLAPPATRPVLNRYYSTPMNLMSPSRQHFRLHNPVPHHVKETLTIKYLEDARGRFINQYQITRVVGRGSFGMVYLAVDSEGQKYALKECSKRQLAKLNRSAFMRLRRQIVSRGNEPPTPSEISSLITREIAVMKKLDHPNLVTLYEVLDDPRSESLILVLEWCAKGTIMPAEEEYDGKAKSISEMQSRLYFRDLILGVEYLHARGVCHRDIKADNVLLGEGDVVKIADFGVSEIFDLTKKEEDSVQRPVGSLAYMSPELVRLQYGPASDLSKVGYEANPNGSLGARTNLHPAHAPISGRKADIWAMGVTLYYMVQGRLPFEASSISGLHYNILTKEPDLSNCTEDLADLLKRIFAKSPAQRMALSELREHPWVTQNGLDPLLPIEENVQVSENDKITEEDMRTAVDRIIHRPGAPRIDLSTVVKSLRTNHGWHGWNGSKDASESSSGAQTPQCFDSSREHSPSLAASDSSKMYKLSRALEELFKLQDSKC